MTGGRFVHSRRLRLVAAVAAVLFVTVAAKPGGGGGGGGLAPTPTPIQIFGAWHCSDDACTWATVRTVAEFDSKNHWLVDRGNGQPVGQPRDPQLRPPAQAAEPDDRRRDRSTACRKGMTPEIVNYFKSRGHPGHALDRRHHLHRTPGTRRSRRTPTLLGQRAAALAQQLGVGIEIDYEENSNPNLAGPPAVHQRLPGRPSLRRHRREPRRAADHRHRRRRPLADRDQPEGHRRLAANRRPGPRLRERDGPGAPAEREHGPGQLAGAHRRQAAVQPGRRAAGAGEVHRRRSTSPRAHRSAPSATTTAPR